MRDRWQSCEQRILELLADEAVFGISTDEQEELRCLLGMTPDIDRDCMERMAATVQLASVGRQLQPLPKALEQSIRDGVPP